MAKIDMAGWKADLDRRQSRVAEKRCPMCGEVKRAQDNYCSDECKEAETAGRPSEV